MRFPILQIALTTLSMAAVLTAAWQVHAESNRVRFPEIDTEGVPVPGVLKHIPRSMVRRAAFEIPKKLFEQIKRELAQRSDADRDDRSPGDDEAATDGSVIDIIEIRHARRQGFQLDSKLRKALERHAMESATRYFTALGYAVEDRSSNHPYDLLCTAPTGTLHVEVKGTQTQGDAIFLTRGEVQFALRHKGQMALFLLHSIQVSKNGKVAGGVSRVINPWDVENGRLTPISFEYELATDASTRPS